MSNAKAFWGYRVWVKALHVVRTVSKTMVRFGNWVELFELVQSDVK